ncbi:MAG: cyclase family protein, partial [Candidatus Kariarchaeaceae archaeon]
DEEGNTIIYRAKIQPFLTHEQSKPLYNYQAQFEITEMTFQSSIGTYLDSPFHRYPEGRDISQILLNEVILPGEVIDSRNLKNNIFTLEDLPKELDVSYKAVLFNFGWSHYWGTEKYYNYPHINDDVVNYLIDHNVKLVGVDTINIDNSANLSRPAHTKLLSKEIFIVENLTNLESLYKKKFRFFAVPIKVVSAAALPVRAFAEINIEY